MLLVVLLVTPGVVLAYQNDYAEDVSRVSDPSPTARASHVNDYRFQDEQINLGPESGIVRVLRTNQKALVNDFVTAVITLKCASPRELRGLARTICRKEGGDADTLWDWYNHQTGEKIDKKNWPDAGKGLVVVCPQNLLPYIAKTLATIDQSWVSEVYDGSWVWYYKGKNRDVRDIMRILTLYATPDGAVDYDVSNNALLRSDQPCIVPLFKDKGIKEVDIPVSKLTLDTQIYEVDTNDELSLGVDFQAWKNGPGARLFRFAFLNQEQRIREVKSTDWFRLSAYDFLVTSAYVDFMKTKGKAKLLTNTVLSAVSGTYAAISTTNGVMTYKNTTPATPDATPDTYHFDMDNATADVFVDDWSARNIAYKQVDSSPRLTLVNWTGTVHQAGVGGVILAIAPVVGQDSAEMEAILGVSEYSGFTPAGDPIIANRTVSSTFEVRNNQPIVMSGLCRTTKVKTTTGIPYLSDIPYVGPYLFGKTADTVTQKRVAVVMKPHFEVFSMDAQSAVQPIAIKTATAVDAKGKDAQGTKIPAPSFGFDQWLLDKGKKGL